MQVLIFRFLSVLAAGSSSWAVFSWSGSSLQAPPAVAATRHFDLAQALNSEAKPLPLPQGAEGALEDAVALSRGIPLASYPYVMKAMASYHVGRPRAAEQLMLHGLRIDPRNPTARGWLLYYYLRVDRIADAIDQGAALYRLDQPELTPHLSSLFAALLQLPEAEKRIMDKLAGTPYLVDILRNGLAAGLDPRVAQKILDTSERVAVVPGQDQVQTQIVSAFLEAGEHEEARAIRTRLQAGDSHRPPNVANGSFQLPVGTSPFDWQISNTADVETEIASTGLPSPPQGLKVDHHGGHRVLAASQLILLPPSAYRFSFLARSLGRDGKPAEGAWEWRIRCSNGARTLTSVPFEPVANWQSFARSFEVPPPCQAQNIELVSPSSEAKAGRSIQTSAVAISPQ